jgi:hypothetical protein
MNGERISGSLLRRYIFARWVQAQDLSGLGGDLLKYTLRSPDAFGCLRPGNAVEFRARFAAQAHSAEARRSLCRRLIGPQMPSSLTIRTPTNAPVPSGLPSRYQPHRAAHHEADRTRSGQYRQVCVANSEMTAMTDDL